MKPLIQLIKLMQLLQLIQFNAHLSGAHTDAMAKTNPATKTPIKCA